MDASSDRSELLRLARKYVWWTPPERVVDEELDRLVVSVMELGTWEDAARLVDCAGTGPLLSVLESPPAGIISDRSLAFWHRRLGRDGPPPRARRRFG